MRRPSAFPWVQGGILRQPKKEQQIIGGGGGGGTVESWQETLEYVPFGFDYSSGRHLV